MCLAPSGPLLCEFAATDGQLAIPVYPFLACSRRRTEQNRSAQRAFRERRMLYIKTLEEQLSKVADELADATRVRQENSELVRLIRDLQRENEALRLALLQDGAVAAGAAAAADAYADSPETTSSIETRTSSSTGSDTVPTSLPDLAAASLDGYDFPDENLAAAHAVYDVDKLKYEVGDVGTPAYEAVFAHLTPDGRLRPVDSIAVAAGAATAAFPDDAGEEFAPFAPAGVPEDALPAAVAVANSNSAAVGVAVPRAPVTRERLASDVSTLAGPPPPLFPLVTPPISDLTTPAFGAGGFLGFDSPPREPPAFFDDADADNEVPSLSLGGSGADLLTPPTDGTPASVGTPVAGVAAVSAVPSKRHLDESDLYVAPADRPAELKKCEHVYARSRAENGATDPVEEELCEKLRQKALLGHVDPSELNKSKFIKRTTAT